MILTQLIGGLGNQMFQYAAGKSLALQNNTDLKLDLSWYNKDYPNTTPRHYQLDNFNITAPIATKKEKIKLINASKFHIIKRKHIYKEKHFQFDPNIQKQTTPLYLEGYFQSYKYFQNVNQVILKEFTLKKELPKEAIKMTEIIEKTESISIHIRRGDYVSLKNANQFHGICTPEYYQKAINTLIETIQKQNPGGKNDIHFLIFSDDTDWVKQNITIPDNKANNHYIADLDLQDYEEQILMSYCKHNIIANSSFSWWSAWLNQNPNKIIIAPINWFADPNINTIDLIPPKWIRV